MTVALVLPARWCFDRVYYLWSAGILTAAGVRLSVEGGEGISDRHAYFFVGNHQSAMDIPVMAVVTRGHSRFMAKKSLFHIPMVGWCMWLHGFVPIDRGSPRRAKRSIEAMLARLRRRSVSMVVFPEGTRNAEDSVGDFKRGAINVCQQSGMPLVAFAVRGSRDVHAARVFRIRPGPVRVALGKPVTAEEAGGQSSTELCEVVHREVSRMYEQLGRPEQPVGNAVLATEGRPS